MGTFPVEIPCLLSRFSTGWQDRSTVVVVRVAQSALQHKTWHLSRFFDCGLLAMIEPPAWSGQAVVHFIGRGLGTGKEKDAWR